MLSGDHQTSMSGWLVSRIDYVRVLAKNQVHRNLLVKLGLSDIVNDTFAALWRDRSKCLGKTDEARGYWLRQVFINRVSKARRLQKTKSRDIQREQPISSEIAILDDHTPALERVMCRERSKAVKAAIAILPPHYQIAIALRSDQNLSFPEIGTQLGLKTDAASKLYARAVQRLRETLGPEFDPCG